MQNNNSVIQGLWTYWEQKKRLNKGRIPSRDQINPFEIKSFLPYLLLLDVTSSPLDFRYRLIGTGVCCYLRKDYTGMLMSEVPHQNSDSKIWNNCSFVATHKKVFIPTTPYVGPHKKNVHAQDILLPLSNDDCKINMILVGVEYHNKYLPKELPMQYLLKT